LKITEEPLDPARLRKFSAAKMVIDKQGLEYAFAMEEPSRVKQSPGQRLK